ncbi:MAG TPA: selenocysteine-specific translation elongation factor [Gemmatimonadales bacterium]|nr:selenocysteine-specific translation elongation factor [Gemmatimonadales bacterium]
MIVGTAGHIDHGKSALVTALTGRTMDRLAEERRRGITIDLNFAPLDLGDGVMAGVVDVPGHEDFVRTMVAGASGFDLALLVVAADEGIMPQTEEHLAILEQLAIPVGVPVVTKADLVDPDWGELVVGELAERLSHSSVRFDFPLLVSAVSGQGVEALRARLREHAGQTEVRLRNDLFRLPVDRAFSVAGAGTVVTGTAWSGSIGVGDQVRLLPGRHEGRVRSIESHGRPVEHSEPGARVAVGIAGLERAEVRRGDVLVSIADAWAPTVALDAEVSLLPSVARSLAARTRLRVHLGTAEVMARALPRGPIAPGERGLVRLRLEAPVVARGGDRFVLRSFSPVTTIGGGRVLDPLPPARAAPWPEELRAPDPVQRLGGLIARRPFGLELAAVPVLSGMPAGPAATAGRDDPSLNIIDGHMIPARVVAEVTDKALQSLKEFHRRQPVERGMPLETLRRTVRGPEWLIEAAIGGAIKARRLMVDGSIARLPGFEPRVTGGEPEIDRLVQMLQAAGLTPPSVAELERETGRRDVAAVLRLAAARGLVEAVERDRYYAVEALRRFTAALEEIGRAGPIHPPDVRARVGVSRKFLIPLLEWADTRGITVRAGDARRLVRAAH